MIVTIINVLIQGKEISVDLQINDDSVITVYAEKYTFHNAEAYTSQDGRPSFDSPFHGCGNNMISTWIYECVSSFESGELELPCTYS